MGRLGADWTFRSDGYQANNYGLLAGDQQRQNEASMTLINAAIACGAKMLILPECGHAYGALRWMGANIYGKPLPFKVLHISEYLADNVRSGKLKLKQMGKSVTFHDPCQTSRRGGVTEAPREVLAALGIGAQGDVSDEGHELVLRRRRRRGRHTPGGRAAAQGLPPEDEPDRRRPAPSCR